MIRRVRSAPVERCEGRASVMERLLGRDRSYSHRIQRGQSLKSHARKGRENIVVDISATRQRIVIGETKSTWKEKSHHAQNEKCMPPPTPKSPGEGDIAEELHKGRRIIWNWKNGVGANDWLRSMMVVLRHFETNCPRHIDIPRREGLSF